MSSWNIAGTATISYEWGEWLAGKTNSVLTGAVDAWFDGWLICWTVGHLAAWLGSWLAGQLLAAAESENRTVCSPFAKAV